MILKSMPDLGTLSLSASLALTRCPAIKLITDPPDLGNPQCPSSVKTLGEECDREQTLSFPVLREGEANVGNEIRALRRNRGSLDRARKASNGKGLEDYVRTWVQKKMESGVPESRCSLPFLVGAKKMVDCLVCHDIIYPGDEVLCSVRDCQGVYHLECAKARLQISNLKNFKCPQHACFICKNRLYWRCVQCPMASHDKCAPWPDTVMHLEGQSGRAVCWRHPTNWRLDREHAACTSDMEEVFGRLPLPYVDEEFKIDLTWKDMENKMELPPYVHIRRNVYLVKKKRNGAADDTGCTNCSTVCSDDCVCRVQCISCSKACRCSENCTNRPFRKERKINIVKTEFCGWGVVAAEKFNKGDFIIEYIGEVIDDALCEQRLWDMKYRGAQNFYMCEIRKDFTIDATFKGNASRFLNHGCDPNCILEKWQFEGEVRVGVFAARSIEVGEPLTYDYRFVQFGPEVKCHCGASNCQGYLGTKRKIGKVELCWGSKRKRTSTACIAIITV
ncbi:hypothetical protein I3760_15G145500 [Carya illinoinensis]|uniref:Histone-lysine N-methyltransferase ASHR3 n=1 Tax=Carya illinoinensis TaxID=32201 RepID=A0A8T1NDG8_CARIL|nr:histone-lysine N-methyltransferase ASHR3 [Carya illinoinensis]KAG2668127.1 hypothetical protein I3760_15G145500 [Carya illinoinensis]KAG6627922.1 hypothetical protein CIPAW_15G163700 [Carya illinoinensis]KAG6676327.1 hypothetical protein I3842_15G146100 [Carya illinoinensis]